MSLNDYSKDKKKYQLGLKRQFTIYIVNSFFLSKSKDSINKFIIIHTPSLINYIRSIYITK